MATVTEARMKRDAMELLSNVMQVGEHDYGQDQLDTALDVLGILRDNPVDDAFGLTEEEVEWASSVPWIEGEPWVVSVARLVKERDAEQDDTAPAEGMTQQEILAGLTGLARKLEQAAENYSTAKPSSLMVEAKLKGASNAFADASKQVYALKRKITNADKLVQASDGIDISQVAEKLRGLRDGMKRGMDEHDSNEPFNKGVIHAWIVVSKKLDTLLGEIEGAQKPADDGIEFDEETDAVTRPSDAERDAEQDDD